MRAFYDTETTGLFKNTWTLSDSRNPHIVQLALKVVDKDYNTIAFMDRIIKPDLYKTIDQKALEAHGITLERAMEEGVAIGGALEEFDALIELAEELVAFNEQFDKRLLKIDYTATGIDMTKLSSMRTLCMMQTSKPICKMPATERMLQYGFNGYKPPKLAEAHRIIVGTELEGAHDAMNDVDGTIRIHRKLFGSDNKKPS